MLSINLNHVKVLVVEDSIDNQIILSRLLQRNGADVTLASNGAEGFRVALSGDFDVVLMDLQMPVMDGIQATASLRRAGYEIPIVALTANVQPEDRFRTREAGCDRHLAKPVSMGELLETVASVLISRTKLS
jgi:CheY-like chemotaxis protein